MLGEYIHEQLDEWVRCWPYSKTAESFLMIDILGPLAGDLQTGKPLRGSAGGRVRPRAFDNALIIFHSKRTGLNSHLLCLDVLQAVTTLDSQPVFGVCLIPVRYKCHGLSLLASVQTVFEVARGIPARFFFQGLSGSPHGTWGPYLNYILDRFLLFIAFGIARGLSWHSWIRTLFRHPLAVKT